MSPRLIPVAAVLLASAAAADPRLSCEGCGPPPPELGVDLARCQPAALASVGQGRFIEVANARLWLGVSDEGQAWVAGFEPRARAASWCRLLPDLGAAGHDGAVIRLADRKPDELVVRFWVSFRLGGCAGFSAEATVSRDARFKRWAIVSSGHRFFSPCSDAEPGR